MVGKRSEVEGRAVEDMEEGWKGTGGEAS